MSTLTPEGAFRMVADHLAAECHYGETSTVKRLRAEADRLEAAAKTPGQVARAQFTGLDSTGSDSPAWNAVAAAVIAHVIGPDRVVAGAADVEQAVAAFGNGYTPPFIDRLREALA